MKQKLSTFILILIVWIIFAGRFTLDVLIIGVVASLLTTVLFGEMLFRSSNRKFNLYRSLHRMMMILAFIPVFFYEAIKSAVEVSGYIFMKELSFSPGIVKVKTRLTNVTAITILANLITLTPGTLTLDFDISERAYYIHWIDVKSREEAEARKVIIEKFENWLDVIFK
ncbi:MAG: Na+/H+ antiporter subunit E [Halanaerobiales bacterium]